jgi:pSer/pThr/pTyr-binding forkhead associated (FHA) protein
MDRPPTPDEADGLPAPGLHAPPGADGAEDFSPLRLVLQPTGLVLTLDRPDMLIGRHSACDVRLPLPDVSRRHCRFVHSGGRWAVVDLNSLNGVFVNNEAVRSRAEVRQGDLVRIGGFTFAVDLTPAALLAARPAAGPDGALLRNIVHTLPRPESDSRLPRRKAS